jgi:peroxiredoxin Q/BCP
MKIKPLLMSLLSIISANAAPFELGSDLPELKGTNQDGKEVMIKAAEGHQWLVVFTYPKALTGGCTKQVCSVRDSFEELKGKKVTIFGMSTDSPEQQKKFHEKHGLPYDLISDPKGALAAKLGIPVRGGAFAARRAMLFKDGKLVWKDDEGATATQGVELLAAIEKAK